MQQLYDLYAAAPAVGVSVPGLAGARLPDHERVEVESELAHLQQARVHVATRGSTDLGPRPARPHLAGGGGGGARAEVGVVVGRHGPAAPAEGAAHSEPEQDED